MSEDRSTSFFSFSVKKGHLLGRTVPSSPGQLYWLTLHHVDPEMYLKVSGAEGSCYKAQKVCVGSDRRPVITCQRKRNGKNTPIRVWHWKCIMEIKKSKNKHQSALKELLILVCFVLDKKNVTLANLIVVNYLCTLLLSGESLIRILVKNSQLGLTSHQFVQMDLCFDVW